jgi:2TM domain
MGDGVDRHQGRTSLLGPRAAGLAHEGSGDLGPLRVGRPSAHERQQARKRVQARRDFSAHLVSYLVVNAFLILVWAVTGAGYFWPIWIIGGWGVGLALHAWDTFVRKPVTEADVDAELTRQRRS